MLEKRLNCPWAQLIWTPKAQRPNCSSPIRIGLLYCSPAHSEIGPPKNPKPN
jgi:hypothetical protein